MGVNECNTVGQMNSNSTSSQEQPAPAELVEVGDEITLSMTNVVELHPGESTKSARGQVVVCIPVYGAYSLFTRCLESVLRHSPDGTKILVADDASPDPAIRELVLGLGSAASRHQLFYLRQPANLGFVGNVNAAMQAANPADVLIVNSDCVVAEGWLDGMKSAAYCDTNVATSSSLTNHGTILSVPYRNRPVPDFPQNVNLTEAACRVSQQSLKIRPRIPTAVGHCTYIRRHAIDLVGAFDLAFSPGYGEEVDFSQRCMSRGMVHVAADDVLVYHAGGGSFDSQSALQAENESIIRARYPYYDSMQNAFGQEPRGPLAHSLAVAKHAVLGMSVTIDGRILGPLLTGTQVHTLELIVALARNTDMRIRVIMPPEPGEYAIKALRDLTSVELIDFEDIDDSLERTTIAHRPYQVSSEADLELLHRCGDRVVVTHQDLIAYRNPSYFSSFSSWDEYRQLTRIALSTSDLVLFFSAHAADDAMADELVDQTRARVVHIGVDHSQFDLGTPNPSDQLEALGDSVRQVEGPFILQIGADYSHKNRGFAIRLLAELRKTHGWDGRLVLAGPRVPHGSSRGEESELLLSMPECADSVVTLGVISDTEKEWLVKNATAVLYPTLYEGFGLVPFESAQAGTPCLFACATSLNELFPTNTATLVPWDADQSAANVISVLQDESIRQQLVDRIRSAGERFTWANFARELAESYKSALFLPDRDASRILNDTITSRRQYEELGQMYDEIWFALSDEERKLIGPDGALKWSTQRMVLKLSQHKMLNRFVFGLLKVGYTTGRGFRRIFSAVDPAVDNPADKYLRLWSEKQRQIMSDRARAVIDEDKNRP